MRTAHQDQNIKRCKRPDSEPRLIKHSESSFNHVFGGYEPRQAPSDILGSIIIPPAVYTQAFDL